MSRAPVLLSFLLSAALAASSGVIWFRLVSLTVGNSHFTMTLVLLTALSGLTLGVGRGGRAISGTHRPWLYGVSLLVVGLHSVVLPHLVKLAGPFLGVVYRLNDGSPSHPLFLGAQFVVCALLFFPPAVFLGAALPFLVRHLNEESEEAGLWMGILVSLAGLGGAIGVWSSWFILIPWLGLENCLYLAGGTQVLLGLITLTFRRRARRAEPERVHLAALSSSRLVRISLVLLGVVQMVLVLSWMRAATLSLGNTAHAHSMLAGMMILGLAGGSLLGALFADRLGAPQAVLGWILTGIAVLVLTTTPALGVLPIEFAHKLATNHGNSLGFPLFLILGGISSGILFIPATLLMGMTFPLLGRLAAPTSRGAASRGVGEEVGRALSLNVLGWLAGATLVELVLLPALGRIWIGFYLAAFLAMGTGLTLAFLDRNLRRRVPLPLVLGSAALTLLTLFTLFAFLHRPHGVLDSRGDRRYWNPLTLSLEPFLNYLRVGRGGSVAELEKANEQALEVLYYRDGGTISAAVTRRKIGSVRSLHVSGELRVSRGGGGAGRPMGLLAGHVPLLARPHASSLLCLGTGDGTSLRAMTLYPELEKITCVAAFPEALELLRRFSPANRRVLENPRVRVVVGDPRVHLRHSDSSYDVICSQHTNFWSARRGILFTREYFEMLAERLEPGGVVCQWFLNYRIRPREFQTVLRTFTGVFPHANLWPIGNYVLLLGAREPLRWHRDWLESCLEVPGVARDLGFLGVREPETLFRYFRMENGTIGQLAGEGQESRDGRPWLEYRAPLGLINPNPKTLNDVARLLVHEPEPLTDAFPGFDAGARETIETHRRGGANLMALAIDLSSMNLEEAMEDLLRIQAGGDLWVSRNGWDLIMQYGTLGGTTSGDDWSLFFQRARLAREGVLGPGNIPEHLLRALEENASGADWTALVLLAQAALQEEDVSAARSRLGDAGSRGAPPGLLFQMKGHLAFLEGDLAMAEGSYRKALDLAPETEIGDILFNLGFAREAQRDYSGGVAYQRQALAAGADPVRSGVALARCLRLLGQRDEAYAVARRAALGGESAEAFYEAARALMDQGRLSEAREFMTRAAGLDERYREELQALEKN